MEHRPSMLRRITGMYCFARYESGANLLQLDILSENLQKAQQFIEIASLLSIKGHHTPTYDHISRESTLDIVAGAKQ
jgi:hypothetical protein